MVEIGLLSALHAAPTELEWFRDGHFYKHVAPTELCWGHGDPGPPSLGALPGIQQLGGPACAAVG